MLLISWSSVQFINHPLDGNLRLLQDRALSGKNSRNLFRTVNILFTSGRLKNRFTTGSRIPKKCERAPEFGVLFTFLYLLMYQFLGSFFTKT